MDKYQFIVVIHPKSDLKEIFKVLNETLNKIGISLDKRYLKVFLSNVFKIKKFPTLEEAIFIVANIEAKPSMIESFYEQINKYNDIIENNMCTKIKFIKIKDMNYGLGNIDGNKYFSVLTSQQLDDIILK